MLPVNPVARRLASAPFYYGWAVAAAISLTILGSMTFALSTASAFVEPISKDMGWSRTSISGAISFGTIAAALTGPLFGRWVDRSGPRIMLSGGSIVGGCALLGLGISSSLLALYVLYTLGRVFAMNVEHLVGPASIAKWFVRDRALATAIALAASRIGVGCWPAIAGLIFVAYDWRVAFYVMGVAMLVQSVVPWLIIVARRPEDMGLMPDGDAVPNADECLVFSTTANWTAREATSTSTFWLLMIAGGATMVGFGAVGLHRIPYYLDQGISEAFVGPILIGFAVGLATGGFVAARLTKYVSERFAMAGILLCGALQMIALIVVPANWWAVAHAFGDGLVMGGFFTLQPVIYASFFGRNAVGSIMGLAQPALLIGNAAGAFIGGAVYDLMGGNYTWVWGLLGVMIVVAASAVAMAKRPGLRGNAGTPVL